MDCLNDVQFKQLDFKFTSKFYAKCVYNMRNSIGILAVLTNYGRSSFLRLLLISLLAGAATGCSVFGDKEKDYSEATAEQLYEDARTAISKKRYESAIEILRTLEGKYPYGVYAEQAQLDTIYVYYLSEQPGLALAAADRFIKLHPTHKSVDYAYYLKGLVTYNEDKSLMGQITGQDDLSDRDASAIRASLAAFEELYTLYPESQYGPEARKRAKYLTNALARNEIAVARYYYSRGAYVAVVNRAKGVVEQFSATPSVEQALALMMFSYTKMGFDDLSADSRRVLELNFPDTEYLAMDVNRVKFSTQGGSSGQVSTEEDEGWLSSLKDFLSTDDSVD